LPLPAFGSDIQVICGCLIRFLVFPCQFTPDAFFSRGPADQCRSGTPVRYTDSFRAGCLPTVIDAPLPNSNTPFPFSAPHLSASLSLSKFKFQRPTFPFAQRTLRSFSEERAPSAPPPPPRLCVTFVVPFFLPPIFLPVSVSQGAGSIHR
jgi:hypothetical protein